MILDLPVKTYRAAIPDYNVDGMAILDVGCADGSHFANSHYAKAAVLCGVDIDQDAIRSGRTKYLNMTLRVGMAERLPYEDESFDLVVSRVTLPLTNIPVALSEIYRVLKPDGRVYLAMHDVHHQTHWLKVAVKNLAIKRVIDILLYVFPASILFNLTGICVSRPWNGIFETFQTHGRMHRSLTSAGFRNILYKQISRYCTTGAKGIDRHNIFEAIRT